MDYTPDAEVPDVIATRPDKFSSEKLSALHDATLGRFMEQCARTVTCGLAKLTLGTVHTTKWR